jgi:ATP-dependent DNA helicase DinG|uniref:DNA 5'-3' helicase n=1 Tax=uncultured bacterium A1Q1_fos_2067 TaxID=1256560 RepID=L7VUZ2_9BACT|nr:DinG family ATP-dependent helicase YoaA [uncultured bacterium A1Q1_fos_2067]
MINIVEESQGSTGPSLADRMHLAFSEEGELSKSADFEYRPQQQEMAVLVARALETSSPLIVEAATGVGKSLAYLLPAVTFALENKRKAIICTHTINLQEQLIGKDIGIVKKLVGDFHAELLKGRSNYLCPNRLQRAWKETGDLFTSSETAELQMLAEWAQKSQDGTLSDLDFTPSSKVWSLVCSEPHACTPRRCPPGSGCGYQEVRRRIAQADVLILNHTLFFTLLSSTEELATDEVNFLFPRDFVIVDEAHTIENIAARQLGLHVSESNMRFELGRLFNPRTRKGFFSHHGNRDGVREVEQAVSAVEDFFRAAEAQCRFQGHGREFRIREPGIVEDTISLALQRVAKQAIKSGDEAKHENTRLEFHDMAKRLTNLRTTVAAFLEQQEEGHVYWAEKSGGENRNFSFHSAPIDVAEKLEQIFFRGNKSCVFTSATLGVGEDQALSYFRKRVGARKVKAACIESPFDFKKQMRLYLMKRMPEPRTPTYDAELKKWIAHFIDLSRGRAFVLFTSYALMTQMADELEEHCDDRGYRLLVQGRGMPRHQMLQEFKQDVHSVLFGTDSFWTGVDVPGEALSNVIITRLPFAVPDHPLTASRLEHLEEQGLNPFTEYSVPEAILKLRQGVGRLIRSNKDRGICAILDNRILSKPYGKAFLNALPDCPTEIMG